MIRKEICWGVTGVGLKLESIAERLKDNGHKYRKNIYLVDDKGMFQVHEDKNLIEKKNIRDMEGLGKNSS